MPALRLKPLVFNPVGSFYNYPNWRYLVCLDPGKAGVAFCRRKPVDGAGALKRYAADKGVNVVSTPAELPPFLREALPSLTLAQRDLLFKMYRKFQRGQGIKPLFVRTYSEEVPVWHGHWINQVQDKTLKRILRHVSKLEYDKDLAFALKLKHSAEHQRLFCVLGYSIYAGIPDKVIAKNHKLFPSQVRAVRELFFDFSLAPTEPIARAAYLNQLAENNVITDVDRRYFKMIATLGELGLKADADPSTLTPEERGRISTYLSDTMLETVSALYFSIENKKDAITYNQVVNNLATFMLKKEEMELQRARIENVRANTQRIMSERPDYGVEPSDDDLKGIELLTTLMKIDNPTPAYRQITDLN